MDQTAFFSRALFGYVDPAPPTYEECIHVVSRAASEVLSELRDLPNDELIASATADIEDAMRRLSSLDVFRIALVGRTMSGKSTLYEFLTGGDGSRIGFGAQRTTRDSLERPMVNVPDCVVVDTPGVGAQDGKADREAAIKVARRCDLILWVSANESTQNETASALVELADLGKPLVVFLNCRQRIDTEPRRRRFVRHPEKAFRASAGHWDRLMGFLEESGCLPRHRISGHALAAFVATVEDDEALYGASGLEPLLRVIAREATNRRSQWQMINAADSIRVVLDDWGEVLANSSAADSAASGAMAKRADEVRSRLTRTAKEVALAGSNQLRQVLDPARTWYVHADLSQDVAIQWEREFGGLQERIAKVLTGLDGELITAVNEETRFLMDDWDTSFEAPASASIDDPHISGKANRLAKLAARVGPGAIAVGAAMVWNPGGWGLLAIGGASVAATKMLDKFAVRPGGLIDRWLPSRKKKQDLYRQELRTVTRHEVDKYEEQVRATWHQRIAEVESQINVEADKIKAEAVRLSERATRRAAALSTVADLKQSMDLTLNQLLLALQGRGVAARNVKGVVRLPGIGSAVALPEPFRTNVMVLQGDAAEPIVVSRAADGEASWRLAADVVFGASDPPYQVVSIARQVLTTGPVSHGWSARGVRRLANAASGADVCIRAEG